MIKILFTALMGAVLFFIVLSFWRCVRHTGKVAKSIRKILGASFVTVAAHTATVWSPTLEVALISYAFYFLGLTWLTVFILGFCKRYTETKFCGKPVINTIYVVTIAFSALFFVNIFKPIIFSVYTIPFASGMFFVISPTPVFFVHLSMGLAFYAYSMIILIAKIRQTTPFFRIRYYSPLFLLLLIVISSFVYGILRIPLNFSIIISALYAGFFYYELVTFVPRRLKHRTIGRIVDDLKNGIILCDSEGKCIYLNSFVRTIFSCTKDTVLRVPVINSYLEFKKAIAVSNTDSLIQEFDFEKDDVHYALKFSDYVINENDVVIGWYILIEDITSEKKQIYEQKILRTRDNLTKVYNKEFFIEKVEHRLKFDRFTPYYLIVTDLVNFKLINDLYGKSVGDDILMRIADSFRRFCSPDDLYGRLYNDHFVMLVPKRHFHEEAWLAAFQKNMSYMNNMSYTVIGHMGIYEIDDFTTPVSVMCDRAILALKTIKNDYRNCFAYYDDTLRNEVLKMQMLMNELPKALQFGEVVIYLQPQFTKDLKVVGAEALVRWQHPERGVIPPADFITIIEKINIISDVDKYVWECACKKLSDWKKIGREDLYISVNISPKDFYTLDLYEVLTGLVKKYGISPSRLNLEITETAVIMDLQNQVKLLDKLRDFGFLVEMDDFGSGYSSLNMLKDISVDVLKIDMGFLQKSQNDKKSRLILEKIIVLAKELGMKVVTEGVENVHQIDFLSEFGCDLFQGFYFSRPIPVSDFEERYFK